MSSAVRFVPLVALLIYLAFKVVPHVQAPEPDVYEPSKSEQALLKPVMDAVEGNDRAAEQLGNLYRGIAIVVGSDRVILNTTDDVRRAHENAGALAVQAGEIPRIDGYAESVNEYLAEQIGTDNVPLDKKKRQEIVEAFRGLEWAMK